MRDGLPIAQRVIHPSTNQAGCIVTMLIKTKVLLLNQATNSCQKGVHCRGIGKIVT